MISLDRFKQIEIYGDKSSYSITHQTHFAFIILNHTMPLDNNNYIKNLQNKHSRGFIYHAISGVCLINILFYIVYSFIMLSQKNLFFSQVELNIKCNFILFNHDFGKTILMFQPSLWISFSIKYIPFMIIYKFRQQKHLLITA
jgi:hypothetical protein